jgi:hypothetical protein
MGKNLSLVVAGSGEIRDLTITPGTTVREVMEQSGLRDYLVSQGPDQPFLSQEEDLFRALPEGAKLYASTPAEAGRGLVR